MPLAVAIPLITAGVGAAASIYGSSQNSKAIANGQAAQSAADQQAIQLQQQNRQEDLARQQPWLDFGNAALGQLAAYHGFAAPAPTGGSAGAPASQTGGQPDWKAYLAQNPDIGQVYATNGKVQSQYPSAEAFAQAHYAEYGQKEGRQLPTTPVVTTPAVAPVAANANPTPVAGAMPTNPGTLDLSHVVDPRAGGFQASPDYAFRQSEAMKAVTGSKAARGLLESGSYGMALNKTAGDLASGEYQNWWDRGRQDFADNVNTATATYNSGVSQFDKWYNRLADAAGIGQQTASSLGASGTNTTNAVSGILQNRAASSAQAGVAQAQNNNGLVQDIAGIGTGLLQNYSRTGQSGIANPVFNPESIAPRTQYPTGLSTSLPSIGLFSSPI